MRLRLTPRRIVAVATASLVAGATLWLASPIPEAMLAPHSAPSVTLTDRFGMPLRESRTPDGERARWIPLDSMDARIIAAFIAVEDRRFFAHQGVDVRGVSRAMRDNIRAGRIVSGASTITMQSARLMLGHSRRGGWRGWMAKGREAAWAVRLERHLGKQTILEQYLNRIELGQGTVGVDAAAALYFGGTARSMSLGEAAVLAGIARSPSVDNPMVSAPRARVRRDLSLERMSELGYAADDEVALASSEPFGAPRGAGFQAPHFTTRTLRWLEASRERMESGADAVVTTTLDLALQQSIEAEVRRTVTDLGAHGGRQAAVVVLENRSGDILAWVGSPDFWAERDGQTDMVTSPRQPGSTLKPFLYALAFDEGHTPATILDDVARTYQTATGPYRPRNYDQRFRGPVRAREALASSYNVPAVELAEELGANDLLRSLRLAGFESLRRSADHYGLGLALGNGEVSLLEMANAYRALANDGVWRPWRWRSDARVRSGEERRVTSPNSAALVLDILSDPVARIPGFGVATPFDFAFPAAVKTGTSRHFTDNWAVATTAGFTVAVWVGDFSGRPMQGVSGVSGAGPLLRRAVLHTAARYDPGNFATPRERGAQAVAICRVSGLRAGERCPLSTEWFAHGTEPGHVCDWHRDEGLVLPERFANWASTAGSTIASASTRANAERPRRRIAAPDTGFRIVAPHDGDRFAVPPDVDPRYASIALRASGERGRVQWFVDGTPHDNPRFHLLPGTYLIRALADDGRAAEVRIHVD